MCTLGFGHFKITAQSEQDSIRIFAYLKLRAVLSTFHRHYVHSSMDESDKKAWKGFVDSVRSKLTVAQVVDGVKGSAELTFDYLLLILTAE